MSRNGGDGLTLGILGVIGLILYAAWTFSTSLGVDFETGGIVLVLAVMVTIGYGALLKWQMVTLAGSCHYYLALLWGCFWPVMNYKLTQAQPWDDIPFWCVTSPWRFGILAAILVVGFSINKWRDA